MGKIRDLFKEIKEMTGKQRYVQMTGRNQYMFLITKMAIKKNLETIE